jgi:hypothetical protein
MADFDAGYDFIHIRDENGSLLPFFVVARDRFRVVS